MPRQCRYGACTARATHIITADYASMTWVPLLKPRLPLYCAACAVQHAATWDVPVPTPPSIGERTELTAQGRRRVMTGPIALVHVRHPSKNLTCCARRLRAGSVRLTTDWGQVTCSQCVSWQLASLRAS